MKKTRRWVAVGLLLAALGATGGAATVYEDEPACNGGASSIYIGPDGVIEGPHATGCP